MDVTVSHIAGDAKKGTIASVLVRVGERIKMNQALCEIQTREAIDSVRAPRGGKVTKIFVKPGDDVSVGQMVLTLEEAGDEETVSQDIEQGPPRFARPEISPQEHTNEPVREAAEPEGGALEIEAKAPEKHALPPAASPTVRRMARQLGIDLSKVHRAGDGGRITFDDLRLYIHRMQGGGETKDAALDPGKGHAADGSSESDRWGPVRKVVPPAPLSARRKEVQERWAGVPQVTQFDDADITDLMLLRQTYTPAYEKKGGHLTITCLALKALILALKTYPQFNATLDETTGVLMFKEYYHIGITVDTEQGMEVPVIRDVDKKSMLAVSIELHTLAEKAREGTMGREEIEGGCFTISNLGHMGSAYFSPIVRKSELATLGIGRSALKPVVSSETGKVETRLLLPVGLSFDYRVINGADAARFLRAFIEALQGIGDRDLRI